jgi:hypothetical protein
MCSSGLKTEQPKIAEQHQAAAGNRGGFFRCQKPFAVQPRMEADF